MSWTQNHGTLDRAGASSPRGCQPHMGRSSPLTSEPRPGLVAASWRGAGLAPSCDAYSEPATTGSRPDGVTASRASVS